MITMKKYLTRTILPYVGFGAMTGIGTAAVVVFYKYLAGKVIHLSEGGYAFIRQHLWALPVALVLLAAVAWLFHLVYKHFPGLQGSGIPTAIAAQRGLLRFRWLHSLIGTFLLSLTNFLLGVPLGTEGPAVQMGAAIGQGTTHHKHKQNAWSRYAMTGGACAGFAVATGAPLSGLLFGIEESHRRLSPALLLVSSTAVMFSELTQQLLAPWLQIDAALFPARPLVTLSTAEAWIPLVIGVAMGLFAVAFLLYYRTIKKTMGQRLERLPLGVKIGAILVLTLLAGLWIEGSHSTGHHLILSLFDGGMTIPLLLLLLAVRATLTLGANTCGMTGGIFVPTLALGALLSAILGEGALLLGMDRGYYPLILTLGLIACIASMMKMPVTAAVFAFEVLGCGNNVLYVIIAVVVSYAIAELFGAESIIETVLEDKTAALAAGRQHVKAEKEFAVGADSFADGKQVGDILWPAGVFVLSVTRGETHRTKGAHGHRVLHAGDTLHVQYTTTDEAATLQEMAAIVE